MSGWLHSKRLEIEAHIARLRARAARIDAHHTRDASALPIDPVDRAQLHANDEVVAQLGASAVDDIAALEAALARIEAGTYEVCAACGGAIARARLDALLATPLCSDCASARAHAPARA